MDKLKSWLWPDHNIGKRESRRLRDEHNATVNVAVDLLAALRRVVATCHGDPLTDAAREAKNAALYDAAAAIAKATT